MDKKVFTITVADDQGTVLDQFRASHYKCDDSCDFDENYGSIASENLLKYRICQTMWSYKD